MKVVAVGGGHGTAVTLKAALEYSEDVAGIITVADDGGSSGRLARELGVLPMGDIRNCLAAVAVDSPMVDVFQHRFPSGKFRGHVVGNLMIAAAQRETGSFIDAIRQAARMLGARGRVVPCTLDTVKLVSEVEGELVEGQVAVAQASGRISYVALDPPDPKAYPEALELLKSADQIILGPGSLFTSVLPNLLVPEIGEALAASRARKVYVMNLAAPPGETSGFDACAHLAAIYGHVGGEAVDAVLGHSGRRPRTAAPLVEWDQEGLESMGVEALTADLLPDDAAPRHDAARLAASLASLG